MYVSVTCTVRAEEAPGATVSMSPEQRNQLRLLRFQIENLAQQSKLIYRPFDQARAWNALPAGIRAYLASRQA